MKPHHALSVAMGNPNAYALALLRALLAVDGHRVSSCFRHGQPLLLGLIQLLDRVRDSTLPAYDVLVIEAAATEVVGQARDLIEQIARHGIPTLLLTDREALDPFPIALGIHV